MKTYRPQLLRMAEAFTLIETLVVVSIIVLILALTGPSLLGTMQATKLTSAGDAVVGFLSEAQQLAQSRNTPVEVRFFKYQTPMSGVEAYRSMMMFVITTPPLASGGIQEKAEPLGTLVKIPDGIFAPHDEEDLSPLLSGEGMADSSKDRPTGHTGVEGAKYNAIRFLTDGSCRRVVSTGGGAVTSLVYPQLQDSCVTLCDDVGRQVEASSLPKNFYCIQIDAYTGKMRTYRPGQN